MKREYLFVLLILFVLILSGCAVGNKHTYHAAVLDLHAKGSGKIAVATHDKRPYVVKGDKSPSFAGLVRGGVGNPFDVSTTSKNPLAMDFTDTIVRALNNNGFSALPVTVDSLESGDAVKKSLKDKNTERSLLVTLNEWKSDTYQNTSLAYDLKMEVLDKDGNTLAEKAISGGDNLKGSFWKPLSHARKVIPAAYKEKLETLLNDGKISGALK